MSKKRFLLNHYNGYTLIELLVVMAVLAIFSLFAFANYKSLKETQNLKSASSDLQSLIRQAQTNAVSRLNCNNIAGASWIISFRDNANIDLKCQVTGSNAVLIKTLTLGNSIVINAIVGNCQSSYPVTVTFVPLTALVTFADPNTPSCIGGVSVVTTTLKNLNTNELVNFKINSGGAINAQ